MNPRRHPSIAAWIVTLLAPILAFSSASAKTLHVATNGLDGPTCGAKSDPCRTITEAIANATDDDTVQVGPGRYGNLDLDPADAVCDSAGSTTNASPAATSAFRALPVPLR